MKEKISKGVVITQIKTDNDVTLSVQTVNPVSTIHSSIDSSDIRVINEKQLCLLIEGETYCEHGEIAISEPVLLDMAGAKQLFKELDEFINAPF